MRFEIRAVANGAVLRVDTVDDGDGQVSRLEEVVYQDVDAEVDAFAAFLRHLVEQYGPSTSRYSPKRIYVRVEPGDKWGGTPEVRAV